jgi:hypothetical protein
VLDQVQEEICEIGHQEPSGLQWAFVLRPEKGGKAGHRQMLGAEERWRESG